MTEASPGAGRPRLVLSMGDGVTAGTPEAEGDTSGAQFPVDTDRVTIGSGDDQNIKLDGLDARHAVIERLPEQDEYVIRPVSAKGVTVNGQPVSDLGLHHGDRLEIGSTTLVFQRDEESDHVRTNNSRQGGQYAGGGITSSGGHHTEHGS